MLKIMFIVSRYEINGVCRVASDLINSLDKQKYEVLLLAEKIDNYHYPVDEDIKIINLDVASAESFFNKIRNIFRILLKIRKKVIAEKPDIVLSFGDTINCYALLATLYCRHIKVIITEHSERFFNHGIKHDFSGIKDKLAFIMYKFLIFFLYRRADSIIAVSQRIADLINKRYMVSRAKIKVINNPTNISKIIKMRDEKVDDFKFKKGVYYISLVSRLSPEKKIERLIKSIDILRNKLNVELIIIGDGIDKEKLRETTASFGLTDIVYFLGYKLNPYKYLKNIDVFVLPSDYEGFPMALIEAMVCGVPVVASDISATKDIIKDGVDGFLVDAENSAVLSERIYNLIINKELKNRIINQACEKVKPFNLENILWKYENIIEGIN